MESQKDENELVEETDSQFTRKARTCVALDNYCTSSVTGKQWLDIFIDYLDDSVKSKMMGLLLINRVFKCGNNGTKCIPLLLSKVAMKEVNMKGDL